MNSNSRRILGVALALLVSLLFANAVFGQGCQVTPYYSNYANQSGDTNNNIYQTVTTSGYASMDTSYCPGARSATHRPFVTNTLTEPNGTVHGGNSYGSSGCASCYISAQSTLAIVGVPGIIYIDNVDGWVACSLVGTFWSVGGGFKLEIATTLSQTTGSGPSSSQWAVTPYCTSATTPPDYAPNYASSSTKYDYFLQKAICKNNSGLPGGVFCIPLYDTGKSAPQDRYACTKNLQ